MVVSIKLQHLTLSYHNVGTAESWLDAFIIITFVSDLRIPVHIFSIIIFMTIYFQSIKHVYNQIQKVMT